MSPKAINSPMLKVYLGFQFYYFHVDVRLAVYDFAKIHLFFYLDEKIIYLDKN